MNRPFRLSLRKPASSNRGVNLPDRQPSAPPPPVASAPAPATQQPPATPRPAPPSPLDRVLSKAANKARLSHPAAEAAKAPPTPAASGPAKQQPIRQTSSQQGKQAQQQKQLRKPQANAATTSGKAAAAKSKGAARGADGLLDDELFAGITEKERDDVWESLKLEVEGDEADLWDEDDEGVSGPSLARRRAAPASARDDGSSSSSSSSSSRLDAADSTPVASSSGFKGFGRPPAARGAAAAAAASASTSGAAAAAPAAASTNIGSNAASAATSSNGKTGPRGLAKTRALLEETGLASRVEVVGDLRASDAILAAKLAKNGKHVNLTQAEKTAANAGIPFVVVGRNLSADNLRTALTALLEPGSEAAKAVAARAAAARTPTAAELQAARVDMMRGLRGLAAGGGPQQQ
eukprot:XP_001695684.1 predicted protein [Chlamydomonas reinhardtii]